MLVSDPDLAFLLAGARVDIRSGFADFAQKNKQGDSEKKDKDKAGGSGIGGYLTSFASIFVNAFANVIGPLAIIGSVLNSTSSGLQLMTSAANLLAATLGPLLLPLFFAFAVALVELSAELQPIVEDAFPKLVDFMLDEVLPALEYFVDWLKKAAQFLADHAPSETVAKDEVGAGVGGAIAGFALGGPVGAVIGGAIGIGIGYIGGKIEEEVVSAEEESARRREQRERSRPVRDAAIADTVKELQLSLGPKAGFTGIADVGKQIQLAALNESPYQARMLANVTRIIAVLERKAIFNDRPDATARAVYGAGDYTDAEHAGGGGDYGAP
jgi:hypothetical protein